jgi:hypothetical protein
MFVHGDFEDILESCLEERLNWLREEFDFLFKFKNNNYTDKDIQIANKIIDSIIKSVDLSDNNRILDLLSDTLEIIAREYPEFF